VVVKDSNNKFISLNQIDGSILWDYKTPNSPLPIRSWGELTLSNEIIYTGISAGKLMALNSNNGTLIWENTFSPPKGVSEIERSNDTSSKVLVDEYAVYAVSSQGNIASIAKEDGVILWSRPMSSYIGLDANEQNIIVTHNSGSIYSLNKETKKINWRNSDLMGRDVSRPFIFDKFVVVSDYEGYLHFIDLNSGLIRARVKLADSNLLYPIIGEQPMEFIVATLEGQVNVVSIKNSLLNDSQKNEEELKKQQNIENIEYENDIKDNPETKEDSLIDTLIFWD
jgi:outer membrane protein assembly factor BamB